ncbi:MAG: hypothetical protein ACI9GB_003397, partial [Halioglobus sp.]
GEVGCEQQWPSVLHELEELLGKMAGSGRA